MKKLIAMFVALFVNACVVFGAATANDLFDGLPHRKGVCVLIDCSQILMQDVIDNSDYMLYARFSNKTEYETVLANIKMQECFNKTVFLEWYSSTNTSSLLPFTQHFVDVIAVNNSLISDEECERVAVPEGRYFKMTAGDIDPGYPKIKPYPAEMGEWPMFWHAADNNPNSADEFVRYPLMSKWFVEDIEEGTDFDKETPYFGLTAGGTIYVVNIRDSIKYLTARSSFNGEELWSNPASDFTGLTIANRNTEQRNAFATKNLFCYLVEGTFNQLKCYDLTGALVYDHTFAGSFYSGFVTGKDDVVYLASQSSDKIIAVNPSADTILWEKDYPIIFNYYRVVMTISDIMLVASETGNITAFNKTTGVQLWETSYGREPEILISKSGEDFFLKINDDKSGEVRNISDGSLRWISDDIPAEHTDNNSIFCGFFDYSAITSDGNIYAYTTHSSWNKLFSGLDGSYISEAPGSGGCGRTTLSKNMSFGRAKASSFYDTNSNVSVSFLDITQCQASGSVLTTFSANGSMMVLPKMMPLDQNHYALGGEGESHDYDFIPLQEDRLFQEDDYDTTTTLDILNSDWSTYRQNNSRSSGSSVFVGDSINSSYAYNPAITSKPTAPVCVGDYTFYGRADGRIIAVNSTSGVQEWEFCTSGSIMVSPTIWNGRLYAGSEDGFVYCLEATTGRLLWRFMAGPRNRKTALNNNLKSVWPINSGILLQDDSIYFVAGRYTWDGIYAYKLNPISGEVIWRNNEAGYQNESQGKKAYAMSVATIGQNYLWINSKQTISGGNNPIGFNLDTGECTILNTGGGDGGQTCFFKDYLIAGGLKQYNRQEDIFVGEKGDPASNVASEAQKFSRLNNGLNISIQGRFRSISPMGTETEYVSGSYLLPAWDDFVLLSSRGKYNIIECYNTDDFKAKLDAAYNPETDIKIATRWRHKSCVVWDGDLPEYKWSNMKILPHTRSMAISGNMIFVTANEPTESEITSVTGDSFNQSRCSLSKKETFYLLAFNKFTGEQLFQEELPSEPLANGIAIDRNGKVVLTMLDGSVSFYDLGSPAVYNLTVSDGTGDGIYNKYEEVNIIATSSVGKMFNVWTGDVANIADINSKDTTLVISDNTTITATFVDAPEVNLFVVAGTGTGTYYQENIVSIKANAAPTGKIFYRWTGDFETIDNIYSSTTTIEIPATDISITAEYRSKSPMLVDFGTTITSPNWNNFSTTLDGIALTPDSISNIITSTNEETPYNMYKFNHKNAIYKTITSGGTSYPESAKGDYLNSIFYTDVTLSLANLNDNNKYTLKFLIYKDAEIEFWINDNLLANVYGDNDATIDFNNISPVNGQINIRLTPRKRVFLSVLEIEESVAPTLNWTPANLAEHISTTSDIIISFDQAVRNINDSEITDANLSDIITLKETDIIGTNIAFTATINAEKTLVTINPDTSLLNSQIYYVAIEAIENNEDAPAPSENITFKTIESGAYALNVVNGNGDGGYTIGTVVDISPVAPPGKHFVNWTGGTGSYGDTNSTTTTYTTVSLDETIIANFANDAPSISDVADAATSEDIEKGIDFTINDTETPPNSLALYKNSSNTTLIPEDNIVFSGTGTDRTVTITPASNQYGTATITITVTDELGLETSDSFALTVNSVNDAPTVANTISDQNTMPNVLYSYTLPENTFNDVENDTLTYSATLDDDSPLPAWLSFNTETRVLSGTHPLPGDETYSIKITGNDGEYNVSDTFILTVLSNTVELTMAVSGNGSTDPISGVYTLPHNGYQNVLAIPDATSFFYNWENTEFATVANSMLSSTTASSITDESTVTAVFRDGPQFEGIKDVASGNYSVSKIVLDDNGNSYICGSFTDTVDFGNSVQLTSNGSYDAFVAKFNSYNICVWAKEVGGTDQVLGINIKIDNSGNLYLLGDFNGFVDFGDGYEFTSVGSSDTFIAKYSDGDGTISWANQIAGSATGNYKGIDVDSNNNVYIAGRLYSGVHSLGGVVGEIMVTETSYYIVKYQNTDGSCLWATETYGESLAIHNGTLLVPGILDEDEVFNFGNGQILTASTECAEFFVAEYNLDGGLCQEAKVIASSSDDYLYSCFIVSDNNNYIYIAGQKNSDLTADGVTYLTKGHSDIYIIKLDASLNCLWGKMIGGERSDSVDDAGIDTDGSLYISGTIQRSITNKDEICYFGDDNTWGISNYSSDWWDEDLYIAKYDSDGNCSWVKSVHGFREESNPLLAVTMPGNIKFIGETKSVIYFDGNSCNPASDVFMMNIKDMTLYPPEWSENYPALNNVTGTSCDILTKTDQHGTAYCAVLGDGATAPTSVQVKAGQDATGTPLSSEFTCSQVIGTSEVTINITGLTSGVSYDIYIVAENDNSLLQDNPIKLEVTPSQPVLNNPLINQICTVGELFTYQFTEGTFYDPDGDDLTYTATLDDNRPLPNWLSLTSSNRTFSGIPISSSILTIKVTALDGTYETFATFTLTIRQEALNETFDVDPEWTTEGDWAFGIPTGTGGDPNSGYTGNNVYGYNLNGRYPSSLALQYLTTIPIDCSEIAGATLSFWRWLGVEIGFDMAIIKVSNDGINWTTIWEDEVVDTSWNKVEYDISAIADGQSTIYIRWGMASDSSVEDCGWNIDDVVVYGEDIQYPAEIEVTASSIDVPEGSTNTFGIRLTAAPENATTVTVAHVSGDTDLSVQSGASLIFSTNTWMIYQYPVIAAAQDDDFLNGTVTIRCSASGMTNLDVTATETDDETDPNPPTVANPISGVSVNKNANNTEIDLTSVFTDTNNDDSLITKAVWSNSNPSLVSASINVNVLTLDYQTDQKGTAEIVIRATSNGQTVDDTFTVEVTDPDALPWTEPFDDLNTGGLSGQHGWTADAGATVQTGTVHTGSRALSLLGATASHPFTEAQANVSIEFHAKFIRGSVTSSDTGTAVAIFHIDTNGYLVAYSNETPIVLSGTTLTDDWHAFKAQLDYTAQTWSMSVDDEPLVEGFAFYSAQSDFAKIAFKAGSGLAFFDEIRVTNHQESESDTDGDGIPDTWENIHYKGITNAIATNLCANGINTILEAYIAGLIPTNASSVFKVSNARNILHWNATNARIYSIYWSSNLLSGDFQPLESNLPWTAMPYTDTNHPGGEQGFYKLEVELEE